MDILKFIFHVLIFPGGLFAIVMALFMSGIDRKLVARMQLRRGPSILQPIYDLLKLIGKEIIVPRNAAKKAFLMAPIIGLAAVLIIPIFIPMYQEAFVTGTADIIVIIYLLTIPALMLIIGGSSSSSPLAGIGASREVVTILAYELPMVMSILAVCKKAGAFMGTNVNFSLVGIQGFQMADGMGLFHLSLIPAAIAFLMVIPAEVGVVPFDMAEAETELCEGPLVEYSGIYLALYKVTGQIKAFIMSGLFVALFLGGKGVGVTSNEGVNIVLNILLFLALTLVVMFISITFVRSIAGRFKINQGLKFFWTIPAVLSLISFLVITLSM